MRTPWWFVAWTVVGLLLWVVAIIVAQHFIAKWW